MLLLLSIATSLAGAWGSAQDGISKAIGWLMSGLVALPNIIAKLLNNI
jgi:hypothetical protein